MTYVYELTHNGKTIAIYSTENKAEDGADYYYNHRLYTDEPSCNWIVRKTLIDA